MVHPRPDFDLRQNICPGLPLVVFCDLLFLGGQVLFLSFIRYLCSTLRSLVTLFSHFLPNAVRILRAHISVEYASLFSLLRQRFFDLLL